MTEAVRIRGRGAASNPPSRFERLVAERQADGWPGEREGLPPLRTEVAEERAGRILTRNASPDLSFDRSVNPYRGCEHVMQTASRRRQFLESMHYLSCLTRVGWLLE